LPIRALLFALVLDPPLLIVFQLLDGISGAVLGVLTALVIADVTAARAASIWRKVWPERRPESGFAKHDAVWLAGGGFGRAAAFVSIAAVGLVAVLIVWFFMPETKPSAMNGLRSWPKSSAS
jgi:hypothetical protein